jgi:hypothetical protein
VGWRSQEALLRRAYLCGAATGIQRNAVLFQTLRRPVYCKGWDCWCDTVDWLHVTCGNLILPSMWGHVCAQRTMQEDIALMVDPSATPRQKVHPFLSGAAFWPLRLPLVTESTGLGGYEEHPCAMLL